MRRPFGASLRIGVSPSAVSLLVVRRWGGAAPRVLAEPAVAAPAGAPLQQQQQQQITALGAALAALLEGGDYAGWPVVLVLADDWLRLWHVTPPPGAARLDDLEAAAALRFHTLYGEALDGWRMLAAWDSTAAFFAAAAPRALLDVIAEVARAQQLAVVGITPHFVSAWNRWHGALKPGAWFGLAHDGVLRLGAPRHGGRLGAVRTLALPAGADHYWLTQTLAREALLLDLPAPTLLQLCGQVPALLCKPAPHGAQVHSAQLDAPYQGALAALSPAAMLALGGGLR